MRFCWDVQRSSALTGSVTTAVLTAVASASAPCVVDVVISCVDSIVRLPRWSTGLRGGASLGVKAEAELLITIADIVFAGERIEEREEETAHG